MSKEETTKDHHKRWKARLFTCLIMLILAFIGLIVMDLHPKSYWTYSKIMAFLYAVLGLGLYGYLRRGEHAIHGSTLWHQLLHWLGLLLTIYITSIFVRTGVMANVQAGLMTLTLLSLTIFLAGVYTDSSFMLIGIMLAIFAAGAALIQAYLSALMIPVILLTGLIIYVVLHRQKQSQRPQNS